MTRLPALDGKEIIAILEGFDFTVERQHGSHVLMKHTDGRVTVVPLHAGETIGPGLFAKILRDIDMTRDDFLKGRKKKRKS